MPRLAGPASGRRGLRWRCWWPTPLRASSGEPTVRRLTGETRTHETRSDEPGRAPLGLRSGVGEGRRPDRGSSSTLGEACSDLRGVAVIDGRLREVKARALAPVVPYLGFATPASLSVAGLAAGLGAAAAAAWGRFDAALVLWFLNRLLDGLDGEVARYYGCASDLGGYVDLVIDFVVYAAIPLGIGADVHALGPVAVLLAAYYVNAATWMLLSQLMERRGYGLSAAARTSVLLPRGIIEGSETALAYTVFLLFPQTFGITAWLFAGAVVATAMQRIWWAWRTLHRPSEMRGSGSATTHDATSSFGADFDGSA